MKLQNILLPTLAAVALAGAGCISVGGSTGASANTDGGLWRTTNRGDAWTQRASVLTASGAKVTNANVNVTAIAQDPNDPKAIYMGTAENGLYYSLDGGDSWQQPALLTKGYIPAVAVDPKSKCRVFVAIENKLIKTEDCMRTWSSTYLDARPDKKTVAVLVDFYNPDVLWVANDAGDVLRSQDKGASWSPVKQFKSPVVKFLMSPTDSRRLYVATEGAGVWRTDDGGANFVDLSANYEKIANSAQLYDMAMGVSDPNMLVLAVKNGLIRTKDKGATWDAMSLLTPEATTTVYSVAVDPKDPMKIYYGTGTTFYKTSDGGTNWVPKKLPTTRAATTLKMDPADSSVIYLGTTKLKQ